VLGTALPMMWREQRIMLIQPSTPILSPLTLTTSPSAPDFPTKFSSVTNSMFLKCIFQQPASTTVSLTLIHYAARTSIQFSDDVASEHEAQGGDGIGHVALRALGCRAGCNLGVGKVFLIE
jgi:hypothetical protein